MYVKRGRRYVPARTVIDDYVMSIPVGSFVLIHAYTEGGRMYQYDIKPDAAAFVAASTIAKQAMVDVMRSSAPATPKPKSRTYSPQELAIINKFRADMAAIGSLLPDWWEYTTTECIAQAGIDAVKKHLEGKSK